MLINEDAVINDRVINETKLQLVISNSIPQNHTILYEC
jgi:hypothetical protein